jgi:hypothetical protein
MKKPAALCEALQSKRIAVMSVYCSLSAHYHSADTLCILNSYHTQARGTEQEK